MLWLSQVFFLLRRSTYYAFQDPDGNLEDMFILGQNPKTVVMRMVFWLGPFFFLLQHWIFAISYLRVAMIFKLVFSQSKCSDVQLLKRREWQVNAFGIGTFVFAIILLICLVSLLEIRNDDQFKRAYLYLGVLNIFCCLLVVVVLTFALIRI